MYGTHQRVLSPVSLAVWYSGSEGTTVGSGVAEVFANGTLASACTGSTIMVAGVLVVMGGV